MKGCERPHVKSKSWTGAVVESAASLLNVNAINGYKSTQTGIKCLVSVTTYCIIFSITIHLHLASFYAQNTFKKS